MSIFLKSLDKLQLGEVFDWSINVIRFVFLFEVLFVFTQHIVCCFSE